MRRPGLTRTRIVSAALELADREGLDSVTLRRLAAELGVHVTSLYNHVSTKETVLDGMIDIMVAGARLPTGPIEWEEWVRRFAASMRAVAQRHPGAFAVFQTRPVQGLDAAASVEAALEAFLADGFEIAEAFSAVKATSHAVLGLVLEDRARRESPNLRTDLSLLPPDAFPLMHAASATEATADTWGYLIEALIAGFATTRRGEPRRRGLSGGATSHPGRTSPPSARRRR